jgi:ABC-type uncharacterized transport system YnjBCD ATPase subunit
MQFIRDFEVQIEIFTIDYHPPVELDMLNLTTSLELIGIISSSPLLFDHINYGSNVLFATC